MSKFTDYCNEHPHEEGQMDKIKKLNKEAEERMVNSRKVAEKNKRLMLKADRAIKRLSKIETFINNKPL